MQGRPAESGAAAERDQREGGEGDEEGEDEEDEGGEGAEAEAEGGEEGSAEEQRGGNCLSSGFLEQTGNRTSFSFQLLLRHEGGCTSDNQV